jgi:hypothetical protein
MHGELVAGVHYYQQERRQSSGSSSIPQTLDLNEYEVVIASDIVNPENMTVAFEDIGNMWQNPIEV